MSPPTEEILIRMPENYLPPGSLCLYSLMESSYIDVGGKYLALGQSLEDRARWAYMEATYGLLAHDGGADPIFTYANQVAQRCFESSWSTLVGSYSRLSASQERQADRNGLLAKVRKDGVARGYRGLRRSASGQQFWIEDVTMWTIRDRQGTNQGQAALFPRWSAQLGPAHDQ